MARLLRISHAQARKALASSGEGAGWEDEGPEPRLVRTVGSRPAAGVVLAGPPGALQAATEVVHAYHTALHADDGGAMLCGTFLPVVRNALAVPLNTPVRITVFSPAAIPERMRDVMRLPAGAGAGVCPVDVEVTDAQQLADCLFHAAISGRDRFTCTFWPLLEQLKAHDGSHLGTVWAVTVMLVLYRLNIAVGCCAACGVCRRSRSRHGQAHNWNTQSDARFDIRDFVAFLKTSNTCNCKDLQQPEFREVVPGHWRRVVERHLREFLYRPGSAWNRIWARQRSIGFMA